MYIIKKNNNKLYKMYKKINNNTYIRNLFTTIFLLPIFLTFINITNAEDTCSSYSDNSDFWLYQERVKCICETYKPEKEIKPIEDKFTEIDSSYYLPSIKSTYKTNMNDIYKCAIVSSQIKSLQLIKQDLINKNPDLLDNLGNKLDEKITLAKLTLNKLWCNESSEKTSIQKLNVLNQTTYETCKYISYLEYLKEKNQMINSLTWGGNKPSYTINELLIAEKLQNSAIDEEINHTYKVFPLAYHAYGEYENNIIIHFLMELINEDYITLREKLHQTLNPINQVVYKISNAMRSE